MKTLIRKLFPCLVALLVTTSAFGQSAYDPSKKIAPELLKQDFILFRDTMKAIHGGLYRYKSKKQIDELFDQGYAMLNDSMPFPQYFNLVSKITSAIEDGHTKSRLPDYYNDFINNRAKLFPIQLRFIKEKAYVPCSTKEFEAGTEIFSINSVNVNTIKKKLFSQMTSDGSTESEKYWKLNQADNKFYWMYYLVYGAKDSFTVQYKAGNKIESKILSAVVYKDVQCLPPYKRDTVFLKLAIMPGNIAVMTVKTFYNDFLKGGHAEFVNFLDSSFKELKSRKVKKLIIDVRSNGGGNDDNGALLFSYLTNKPFAYFASITSTKRSFTVKENPGLGVQQANTNNFQGKVYILINGKSFSTTADFCATARSHNRAIFIGEETGGGYTGNTSGPRKEVILPNTKIEIDIPENMYYNAVRKTKYNDRGTIPDYEVIQTITDYIQQNDVQMNYALKLASQK
jgi:hypothetical protein